MKLKTIKELDWKGLGDYLGTNTKELANECQSMIREEVIDWIKALRKRSEEHWKKLYEFGYIDFPETEEEDAYGFKFEGEYFSEWHEASDVSGATTVLMKIFNITWREIEDD